MDLIDAIPDVRYWSKILSYSIPTPHLLTDLEVKVTDFLMINEMLIPHQSVIGKHSSFKYKNHSITTDPRVHAMGWGWRSKYRTSSYTSDFEFFLFCFKCILVLLVWLSSGELLFFCNSSYSCWQVILMKGLIHLNSR